MTILPWIYLFLLLALLAALAWAARGRDTAPRPSGPPAWLLDAAALALLALAALGFFWRVVSGQGWMPADGGDLVSFLFPTYRFAAATLHSGAWPLWNPYLYSGAPHVADIQAGFLYPPNLLLFLLWPDFPYRVMQWLSIGHVWFAGAGMYLFLHYGLPTSAERPGVARLPALAGGLAFMFSDAFIVHFGNLNFLAVVAWLPLVFWAYCAGLRGPVPRPRQAALAGLVLAIGSLAGHIQATLFILLGLAFYTAAWLWLGREEPAPARRALAALGYLALTVAATVLFMAPVLLPALQLTGYTARASWDYQEAAGYSLAPAQWIGLLIPGFFGRSPQFHWGAWPRVEVGYLGILPLVLAGLAVALRRNRHTWPWLALAAATFVLALGTYALPHGWLTLLPGFGQLRAPARLVFVTDFGLAALAAIGMDAVLRPLAGPARAALERVWRVVGWATAGVGAVVVPLSYLALLLVQDRPDAVVQRISITLIAIMLFAGLLLASLLWLAARRGDWARPVTLGGLALALIFLDAGSNGAYQDLGGKDPGLTFNQPAIVGFLAAQPGPYRIDTRTGIEALWQPDTALMARLEDVDGLVNPVLLADTDRFWQGLGSRSTRLYDLLNVRYIIAKKDVVLDFQKFTLAFDGASELNVYANRNFLPRAFIVPSWQEVAGHETAWQAIHEPGFDPSVAAVIEQPSGLAPGARRTVSGAAGQVTGLQEQPNGLSLQTQTSGPGLLVISQAWYPGWQAWIDGRPAGPALVADYAFQAVRLPAGSHQVELRFVPVWWRAGWVLAGLAALALAGWSIAVRRSRGGAAAPDGAVRGGSDVD